MINHYFQETFAGARVVSQVKYSNKIKQGVHQGVHQRHFGCCCSDNAKMALFITSMILKFPMP